jgi:hypothetical protein
MLGRVANCSTTANRTCSDCYRHCEHSEKIRTQFAQEAGNKGHIKLLIDSHLEQQELFLQSMCAASPDLKTLAQLAGMRCSAFKDEGGCIDVCGNQKRIYLPYEGDCLDAEFTDGFYQAVIKARRIAKYPNGHTLRKLADLFGWSIIYTNDFINIDIAADDPAKAFSVLHIFPIPLGESLRVIGTC